MNVQEFADAAEIHSEMPPLEPILGLQSLPRRCVGDGTMFAGAILGAQNPLSPIIAFPKRLKATSIHKIHLERKIFFGSGDAFGAHLDPPNRSQTLRRDYSVVAGAILRAQSPVESEKASKTCESAINRKSKFPNSIKSIWSIPHPGLAECAERLNKLMIDDR